MDDGYWQNCWKNDGNEEDSVELNEAIDDDFQTATTFLFDVTTLILQPLILVNKEEHYDEEYSFKEIVRHIFTKVSSFSESSLFHGILYILYIYIYI